MDNIGDESSIDEEYSSEAETIQPSSELTGVSHSWFLDDFVVPRFCDCCAELIWGFSRQGYRCSVCGNTIHRRCLHLAHKSCDLRAPSKKRKLKDFDPDESQALHRISNSFHRHHKQDEPKKKIEKLDKMSKYQLRFQHSWTEGRLPLTAMCFVCNAPIMFYDGCECVRCENTAHTDCLSLSEICKPRHKNLIFVEEIDLMDENGSRDVNINRPSGSEDRLLVEEEKESKRSPLLVLINSRSGGKYGASLASSFSDLLTSDQVFVIDQEGPMPILKRFRNVKNLRILACGGDGTIGWIMNCIDEIRSNNHTNQLEDSKSSSSQGFQVYPPVAILPLGTGNDLARTLGWGRTYNGGSVSNILNQIELSSAVRLDRWKIKVTPQKKSTQSNSNNHDNSISSSSMPQIPESGYELVMNNYMSVGIDAQVALDFHETRKENPELFASQLINRMWYFTFGTKALFSTLDSLNKILELYVDGRRVELPPGAGGLLILNIRHYGGGSDFWGHGRLQPDSTYEADVPQATDELLEDGTPKKVKPVLTVPKLDDGLLEVCCMWNSFHLAQISVDLSRARRLVQGKHIKIHFISDVPFPVQMDGEPSQVSSVDLEITHHTVASMLVPMDPSR